MALTWLDALLYGVRRILSAGTAKPIRADLNFGAQFTVADNTGAARTDVTLSGTEAITTTSYIGIGTPVAAAGDLRLADAGEIAWWTNGAGLTRVTLAKKSAADAVQFGSSTTAEQPASIVVGALTSIATNIAGTNVLSCTAAATACTGTLAVSGIITAPQLTGGAAVDLVLNAVTGQSVLAKVNSATVFTLTGSLATLAVPLKVPAAHLAADVTFTDTNLATVATGMALTLPIGKWLIVGRYTTSAPGTDGFKHDFAASGGLVIGNAEGTITGYDIGNTAWAVTRRTDMTADTSGGAGDVWVWREETVIDVTTGGTLTLRGSKVTDFGADTVLRKGSVLMAWGVG